MAGRQRAFRAADRHMLIAIALLVAAILLGGGGSPNPATELWLELLAGAAALAWLWTSSSGRVRIPTDRRLWLVAVLVLALPLLQLVPLPPALWTALPGREDEAAALALVGAENSWRPLSISPPRTLASLLAVVPPVILFAMTGALDPRRRTWLVVAIAAMAALTAVFGAVQLAGGQSAPRLYAASHQLVVTGFQANRNAAADVLLIGLAALAAVAAIKGRQLAGWWLAGTGVILLLAVVLTGSRAGIVLLVPVLAACWLLLRSGTSGRRRARLAALASGGLALALGGLFFLRDNTALRSVAQRFDMVRDVRSELWADSWYAIGQFWPFGSGIGTFVPSFVAAERLEAVDASMPNRAHNDFLELALEAGASGFVVLVLVGVVLALMAFSAWRDRPADRAQVIFALATLFVVAAHSLVDYPLRSMALACLVAVAAGLLASPPRQQTTGDVGSPAPS